MTLEDQYKMYVGAYFGVRELDEYNLKSYFLKEVEEYIKNFILLNPISDFDYVMEAEKINKMISLKRKLQDCLIVLPKLNVPMEVILLIKEKIKKLDED